MLSFSVRLDGLYLNITDEFTFVRLSFKTYYDFRPHFKFFDIVTLHVIVPDLNLVLGGEIRIPVWVL